MLKNDRELENTRTKLQRLEALYEIELAEDDGDEELREASLESLMRMINQLKEEIIRYEIRHGDRKSISTVRSL